MGQKPTAMDSSPSKRPRGRPRKDIIESPRSQIKKSPRSQIRKSPRSQTKPQSQSERLLSLRSRKNLFGTKIPQEREFVFIQGPRNQWRNSVYVLDEIILLLPTLVI